MILAITSFQDQVALRLLEIDGAKRETMGRAAEQIRDAARESIGLIQTYFKEKKVKA